MSNLSSPTRFNEYLRVKVSPALKEAYKCSFCRKEFPSLQSLGGHQTKHRKEIKAMRREHKMFMEGQHVSMSCVKEISEPPACQLWDFLGTHDSRTVEQQPVGRVVEQGEEVVPAGIDLTLKL